MAVKPETTCCFVAQSWYFGVPAETVLFREEETGSTYTVDRHWLQTLA